MNKPINFIQKLYLCVLNNKNIVKSYLELQELAPLSLDVQEKILCCTIKNEICESYPPPWSFKKMFLRTLLDTVEMYGSEHSEELLKEYTKILSEPIDQKISYHSYYINKDCIITLQENNCFVAKSTTGLQTWEASKYLAEWCLNNSSIFLNKTILELGSGIGLLGITVLKMCNPKRYIFTDKSWEVLNVLSSNLKINISNDATCNIQKTQLVWATTCDNEANSLSSDIILGADLVYDKSMVESLVHALKTFLLKDSCAYIASTVRDPETDEKFLFHLDAAGLIYEILKPYEKSVFIYNQCTKFVLYKIVSKFSTPALVENQI